MDNNFNLDDSLMESVLPNNLISVDGEESLAAKVTPYIADASRWLAQELLGVDTPDLGEDITQLAIRAAVIKAVISAIPALDLVVTPSGFGVVSSSSVAPASKERVERLIATLSADLDNIIVSIYDLLRGNPDWRSSAIGRELCATPVSIHDAKIASLTGDIFDRFRSMRDTASDICASLAADYLGSRLLSDLSDSLHDPEADTPRRLITPVRILILDAVSIRKSRGRISDRQILSTARVIIDRLPDFPELYAVWKAEMRLSIDLEDSAISRPGAFFF